MQNGSEEQTPEQIAAWNRHLKREKQRRHLLTQTFKVGDKVRIIEPECLLYFRELDDKLKNVVAVVYSIDMDPETFYSIKITLPDLGIYIPDTEVNVSPDGIVKV